MLQLPVEHVDVAFAREHSEPHAPQFVVDVSEVSHPVASTRSQSPQPAAHDEIVHRPVAQVGVAFVREHGKPHAPQLVSVVSGVSHPFGIVPSQFPNPVRHVPMPQRPISQSGTAFAGAHAIAQPPQFMTSCVVPVSHPFAAARSQSA